MNKKDLISIRYGTPEDFDFIEATWLQGLYYGNPFFELIHEPSYYKNYRMIIKRILNRPDLKIAIACLKDQPSLCLAYSISQEDTLHWLYTKKDWRKIGLMTDLLPSQISEITHLTETGKSIWKKKWPKANFNPFAREEYVRSN